MIKTIMIGSTVSVQGIFVKLLPNSQTVSAAAARLLRSFSTTHLGFFIVVSFCCPLMRQTGVFGKVTKKSTRPKKRPETPLTPPAPLCI